MISTAKYVDSGAGGLLVIRRTGISQSKASDFRYGGSRLVYMPRHRPILNHLWVVTS